MFRLIRLATRAGGLTSLSGEGGPGTMGIRHLHNKSKVGQMQEDSKSWSAADQSASSAFTAEESDIAEDFKTVSGGRGKGTIRVREYTYSTANFHASPRKLRMIGNQISGLPVTEAIRQMQFSAKKAADKIKHSLVWARKNAVFQKQMNPDNMFVKLARVGKGQFRKRLDPKARGRHGIIRIPSAHMKYVLWEKRPEEAAVGRNAEERALLAGGNKLPRRNVKGFQLYKKVWTPLNETKPVMNAPGYYNW